VDLWVALRHVNDWVVDWDAELTEDQRNFVRSHSRYFARLARVLFRKTVICEVCGMLDETKLKKCGRCKQAWYCCRQHQLEHWKEHKLDCKQMSQMRNNEPEFDKNLKQL